MKKGYKYELIKTSLKTICPACQRRRFVPYVFAGTTTIVGPSFGRCDREQNCGYHCYPGNTAAPEGWQPPTPPPPLPAMAIDAAILARYERAPQSSNLYRYIARAVGTDAAAATFARYNVTATAKGATIYKQIDQGGTIRAAKAITYNQDGHRNKATGARWLHKYIEPYRAATGNESPKMELQQCFFGLHTITQQTIRVYIVESEKTGLILWALLWNLNQGGRLSIPFEAVAVLATGGKNNLNTMKRRAAAILKGKDIILLPDNGVNDWSADGTGAKVSAVVGIVETFGAQWISSGADFADILEAREWNADAAIYDYLLL